MNTYISKILVSGRRSCVAHGATYPFPWSILVVFCNGSLCSGSMTASGLFSKAPSEHLCRTCPSICDQLQCMLASALTAWPQHLKRQLQHPYPLFPDLSWICAPYHLLHTLVKVADEKRHVKMEKWTMLPLLMCNNSVYTSNRYLRFLCPGMHHYIYRPVC
jgi:hypothetical protein